MPSERSASFQETEWQVTCLIFRKRSSRCLPPPASVRSGLVVAQSWVPERSWIVSVRSDRRYCLPPMDTSTKVTGLTFLPTWRRLSMEFLHSRRSCSHHILDLSRKLGISLARLRLTTSSGRNQVKPGSSSCHPITPSTSCSHQAQRGSQSAWSRERPGS